MNMKTILMIILLKDVAARLGPIADAVSLHGRPALALHHHRPMALRGGTKKASRDQDKDLAQIQVGAELGGGGERASER
jgi:hypothetical protein